MNSSCKRLIDDLLRQRWNLRDMQIKEIDAWLKWTEYQVSIPDALYITNKFPIFKEYETDELRDRILVYKDALAESRELARQALYELKGIPED